MFAGLPPRFSWRGITSGYFAQMCGEGRGKVRRFPHLGNLHLHHFLHLSPERVTRGKDGVIISQSLKSKTGTIPFSSSNKQRPITLIRSTDIRSVPEAILKRVGAINRDPIYIRAAL